MQKATFYPLLKARRINPLWSQRPWHVIHRYDTATKDTLSVSSFLKEYGVQVIISKETKCRLGIRIAELAKYDSKMKFTSLGHLLNEQSLIQCHYQLPNKKASGVKGTTKVQVAESPKENIKDLVSRLKNKSYRPVPVRRMYIPKLNSDKKRPLVIPEHED